MTVWYRFRKSMSTAWNTCKELETNTYKRKRKTNQIVLSCFVTQLTFSLPESIMETCSAVLTFESVDEILRFDYSNETYSAVVLHGTICFSTLYKMLFDIFGEFWCSALLGVKGLITVFILHEHCTCRRCNMLFHAGHIASRSLHVYVVVQFYPWFKFYFPLFKTHYHTLP